MSKEQETRNKRQETRNNKQEAGNTALVNEIYTTQRLVVY